MRTTRKAWPEKSLYGVWAIQSHRGQRPSSCKGQSPEVLIKINDLAQAQFCFLYVPCHTRTAHEFKKD